MEFSMPYNHSQPGTTQIDIDILSELDTWLNNENFIEPTDKIVVSDEAALKAAADDSEKLFKKPIVRVPCKEIMMLNRQSEGLYVGTNVKPGIVNKKREKDFRGKNREIMANRVYTDFCHEGTTDTTELKASGCQPVASPVLKATGVQLEDCLSEDVHTSRNVNLAPGNRDLEVTTNKVAAGPLQGETTDVTVLKATGRQSTALPVLKATGERLNCQLMKGGPADVRTASTPTPSKPKLRATNTPIETAKKLSHNQEPARNKKKAMAVKLPLISGESKSRVIVTPKVSTSTGEKEQGQEKATKVQLTQITEKTTPVITTKPRRKMVKYVTKATEKACSDIMKVGAKKGHCQYDECGVTTSKRKIQGHCRQHFTKIFCKCGYKSASRDSVVFHQKKEKWAAPHGIICYEVDGESFGAFCADMGWETTHSMGKCIPTLNHDGTRRPKEEQSPITRVTTKKVVVEKSAPVKREVPLKQKAGTSQDSQTKHLSKSQSGTQIPNKRQTSVFSRLGQQRNVSKANATEKSPPPVVRPDNKEEDPPVLDIMEENTDFSEISDIEETTPASDACFAGVPGTRRWFTKTTPSILVVEVEGLTREEKQHSSQQRRRDERAKEAIEKAKYHEREALRYREMAACLRRGQEPSGHE